MEKRIGCVIYTTQEDGTVVRTIDTDKQAEMLAKVNKDSE